MSTQWERLLKNLGYWEGSFTRFSPEGDFLEDTPTVVSLEGLENNTKIHQVVSYRPHNAPREDRVFTYSSLGRQIRFCQSGAFSQGSLQCAPYSQFGAEFGLIEGHRRLRSVILYNTEAKLDKITLIREKLLNSNTPERNPLKIEQLLGEWQGHAVTVHSDYQPEEEFTTHLKIKRLDQQYILQELTYGNRSISSKARLEENRLLFEDSPYTSQILLMADGASLNTPLQVPLGNRFVLEMGWLISPSQRQRLIRSYDEQGAWQSVTLVEEHKIC